MDGRILAASSALAAALVLPAQAGWWHHEHRDRSAALSYPTHLLKDTDTVHSGGNDPALAEEVATRIRDDARSDGATVTVAANNGEVMLSGTAKDFAQANRIEQIASNVAGRVHVAGTLDSPGGG